MAAPLPRRARILPTAPHRDSIYVEKNMKAKEAAQSAASVSALRGNPPAAKGVKKVVIDAPKEDAVFDRTKELPITSPLVDVKFADEWISARMDLCLICSSGGSERSLLKCHDCGEAFHTFCLSPPLIADSLPSRSMWRCPHCKFCDTCQKAGNEDKLIVCDNCDRCFHSYCLKDSPPLVDDEGWRCNSCVVCLRCGVRGSSTWHQSCTLCDKCGIEYKRILESKRHKAWNKVLGLDPNIAMTMPRDAAELTRAYSTASAAPTKPKVEKAPVEPTASPSSLAPIAVSLNSLLKMNIPEGVSLLPTEWTRVRLNPYPYLCRKFDDKLTLIDCMFLILAQCNRPLTVVEILSTINAERLFSFAAFANMDSLIRHAQILLSSLRDPRVEFANEKQLRLTQHARMQLAALNRKMETAANTSSIASALNATPMLIANLFQYRFINAPQTQSTSAQIPKPSTIQQIRHHAPHPPSNHSLSSQPGPIPSTTPALPAPVVTDVLSTPSQSVTQPPIPSPSPLATNLRQPLLPSSAAPAVPTVSNTLPLPTSPGALEENIVAINSATMPAQPPIIIRIAVKDDPMDVDKVAQATLANSGSLKRSLESVSAEAEGPLMKKAKTERDVAPVAPTPSVPEIKEEKPIPPAVPPSASPQPNGTLAASTSNGSVPKPSADVVKSAANSNLGLIGAKSKRYKSVHAMYLNPTGIQYNRDKWSKVTAKFDVLLSEPADLTLFGEIKHGTKVPKLLNMTLIRAEQSVNREDIAILGASFTSTTVRDQLASRDDWRACQLCGDRGDFFLRGRLLPVAELHGSSLLAADMGASVKRWTKWVHAGCALWSPEVFEEDDKVQTVAKALKRGSKTVCLHCGEKGATIGCHHNNCPSVYHLYCAIRAGCYVAKTEHLDRVVYCDKHKIMKEKSNEFRTEHFLYNRQLIIMPLVNDPNAVRAPKRDMMKKYKENQEKDEIELDREAEAEAEAERELDSQQQDPSEQLQTPTLEGSNELTQTATIVKTRLPTRIRVGGLTVAELGEVIPSDFSPHFHSKNLLFPVGYRAERLYWDYLTPPVVLKREELSPKPKAIVPESKQGNAAAPSAVVSPAEDKMVVDGEEGKKKTDSTSSIEAPQANQNGVIAPAPDSMDVDAKTELTAAISKTLASEQTAAASAVRTASKSRRSSVLEVCYARCIFFVDVLMDRVREGELRRPLFRITHQNDPEHPMVSYHPDAALAQLVARINNQRRAHRLPLIKRNFRGEFFFGFAWPHVQGCIERLPGVPRCFNYESRYDTKIRIPRKVYLMALTELTPETAVLQLPPSANGAARLSPPKKLSGRDKYPMLDAISTNAATALLVLLKPPLSKHESPLESDMNTETTSSTQYRVMKYENRRGRLKILRSPIQGWGVFAQQKIKCDEMIVEYVGELINPALSDSREAHYNRLGIGCYMFRIPDEDEIVDATMCGNMARFINHSCEPNARTDWIILGQKKKIIIFATKDIYPGQEIVYDYNFAVDEDDKVPCHCGAKACKGWMNV